jgi:hypothetical protein
MTITKIFYAVYNIDTKKFKGRTGLPWTKDPVMIYDSLPKANAVMERHIKSKAPWAQPNLVVKAITLSW